MVSIHLVSYVRDDANPKYKLGDAYISEVMWGTDASQDPVRNSNWIEIGNGTTGAIAVGEYDWALWFYEAHETPPTAYPADSYYEGSIGQAGVIIDMIGTKACRHGSDAGVSRVRVRTVEPISTSQEQSHRCLHRRPRLSRCIAW